ncbi:MAG: hypothetical protein LBS52_02115 [Dysgonamonadaceae bacterium]|jgi:protocatechuate 3,4-dioxygenase beta subunit|nr:hypothetical protein [Dysgonamonadaceae bacterium]
MKKWFETFNKTVCLLLVAGLASAAFSSCSKDEGNDNGNPDGDIPPAVVNMQSAAVSGTVFDVDGNPLDGVAVTSGTASATTVGDGTFSLSQVNTQLGRAVLKFEKDGYFTLVRANVKNSDMYVEVVLKQKDNSNTSSQSTFDAASAKTLSVGGMKVNVPASAFVREDGTAYSGTVNADMFYLDPKDEQFAEMMPGGDLSGLRSNNTEAQLISYGMTDVIFTDDAGRRLQLASGKESELTFPIPAGMTGNAPETMPLWSFDEERGIWREEGTATKSGNVYVGKVKHFSWVNLDYPERLVKIKGKVTDCQNKPVAYVQITAEQTDDKNNGTVAFTYINGEYILYVPTNTAVTVSIKSEDYWGYTPEISYNIAAQSAETTITQNFSLPCAVTVNGKVTDCADVPIAHIRIDIEQQGKAPRSVYANANGEYTAKALTNIPVTLSVTSYFYGNKSHTIPGQSENSVVTQDFKMNCYYQQGYEGVVINGVTWAPCNVGSPGTFAKSPEKVGMFYQWNSKLGGTYSDGSFVNSDGGDNWDGYSGSTDAEWTAANDPSPEGWRVPTDDELGTLLDAEKVSAEWTTLNGVIGRSFTDKASGASIFLPAAGWIWIYDDGLQNVDVDWGGYYWSGTVDANGGGVVVTDNSKTRATTWRDGSYAFGLCFNSEDTYKYSNSTIYGCSVRSVRK